MKLIQRDPAIVGREKELPPAESNVIRIFISSTFTDMTTERNQLMKRTFPRLQEHFQSKDIEFQIVDMRWGIREESVLDHQATNVCLKEIENSQNLSVGVCFLALLGDKYGNCPLPHMLTTAHYNLFISKLTTLKRQSDVDLLKEWYRLDTNPVPPHYILMPLSEKYLQSTPGDLTEPELRNQHREEWSKASAQIRVALHKAVESACADKQLTEMEKHNYIMSVTEREITEGILNDPLANERTLCFIRTFERVNERSPILGRFMDLDSEGRRLNQETQFLQQLRDQKIAGKLQNGRIRRYSVEWDTAEGLNPEKDPRHQAYLDRLCEDVFQQIVTVSEARLMQTKQKQMDSRWNLEWYRDLEQHVRTVQLKAPQFVQRRKLTCTIQRKLRFEGRPMDKAELEELGYDVSGIGDDSEGQSGPKHRFYRVGKLELVRKPKNFYRNRQYFQELGGETVPKKTDPNKSTVLVRKPVIISGPSGYGKSHLLSKVFEKFCTADPEDRKCLDWGVVDGQLMKIIRFMGTSPKSCRIRDVLESLAEQIVVAFGLQHIQQSLLMGGAISEVTFTVLCQYFSNLLWSLRDFKGNVLILLDAVDQLTPDDHPYNMQWLPRLLPANVYLMITIIPDMFDLLENCEKIFTDHMCYCDILPMEVGSAQTFLQAYGEMSGRSIVGNQEKLILENFTKCKEPMFIKLAFERSKEWKSFTPIESIKLGKNTRELIQNLFESLEVQHGKTIQAALQYINCAREGLTDAEMDDLLSLDDFVMADVFVHHLPPDPRIIRFPTMIWRRIRRQLDEYISVRQADNKSVMNWYHRQFREVAYRENRKTEFHQNLASYFSGEWHCRPKPLRLYKGKQAEYPDAMRNAPEMPWTFDENTPNLRKLTEYPYHLIMAYSTDEAADVLCSFDYLLNKLRFQGFKSLMIDFKLYFDNFAPGHDSRTGDLVYVKIFNEQKELQTNSEQKLNEPSLSVKIIYDLLVMATDIFIADWSELPLSLIGRLGPLWLSHPRILQLVESAKSWCQTANSSLIVPRYHCMASPGTFLRTTINHMINEPGSVRSNKNLMLLAANNLLYVREVCQDGPDCLQVYDINSNGELLKTIQLDCRFDRFQFLDNEKWNSDAVDEPMLINLNSYERVPLETSYELMFGSSSGKLIVATEEPNVSLIEVVNAKLQPNSKKFCLTLLAKVIHVAITPDDAIVVCLTDKGELWRCSTTTTAITLLPQDSSETELIGDLAKVLLVMSPDNILIHRGLKVGIETNLYGIPLNDATDENALKCFKDSPYPLHLTVMHKTGRWIAAATDIDYVFTTTVNANHCRLYVFDVDSTTPVFRVKGTKGAFSCIQFLGDQHQYLGFSRKFDPMLVIVGLGTPDKPNHTATQLLRLGGGHAKAIYGVLHDETESTLITCSSDNTIKTWDLVTVLNVCDLAYKNIHMQKPIDRRGREGQEDFLAQKTDSLLKAGLDPSRLENLIFVGNLADEFNHKQLTGCHTKVIALTKSGRYAVCGCIFGRLSFINLTTGAVVVAQGHSDVVKTVHSAQCYGMVAFSQDESQVFTAAHQQEVMMWETATGYFLRLFKVFGTVTCITVVKSNLYVAMDENDFNMTGCVVWEYQKHDLPTINFRMENGFSTIAVTSDGQWLFTLVNYSLTMIHCDSMEATTPKSAFESVLASENPKDARPRLKITKDDRFAVASVFKQLQILPVGSETLMELSFTNGIGDMELLNSCRHALVAQYRNVELIYLPDCTQLRSFEAHSEYVSAISVATLISTSNLIVTASQDKSVKLWALSLASFEWELLAKITFHCPLRVVKLAPDGTFVLVGPESAAPLAILTPNPHLNGIIAALTIPQITAVEQQQKDDSESWTQQTIRSLQEAQIDPPYIELIMSICSMFSSK